MRKRKGQSPKRDKLREGARHHWIRLNMLGGLARVRISYGNGETKFFDAIRLVSSELNPFGYVQGAIGLVTGVGIKQHTSY